MRILRVAMVIAGVLGSTACKRSEGDKPKVVVSIFPLHDVTRRIAGDRLDVVLALPPGKSEHGYDPTPREIARLEGARLGIAVGLELDGWVVDIMRNAGGSPRMVYVGDKIPTIPIDVEPLGAAEPAGHDDHDKPLADHHDKPLADHHDKPLADHHDKPLADHHDKPLADHHDKPLADHHDEPLAEDGKPDGDDHADHRHAARGAPDPHFWLDPQRMVAAIDVIATELTALDPAGKEAFAQQAAALKQSLTALDAALAARAAAWTHKTIVTFHGSMGYFAARYGLRVAAVVEPLAGKEPTPQYVAAVLAAIRHGRAAALFSEPQLDKRPAEVIAAEGRIPLGVLDPVGGGPGRDSYEALLTWNADQLEQVLR
jgi:zinc transport system substrate-binding protein